MLMYFIANIVVYLWMLSYDDEYSEEVKTPPFALVVLFFGVPILLYSLYLIYKNRGNY